MKPSPSSDPDEPDREIIDLLKDLADRQPAYPPELFAARRTTFLAQVEQLSVVDTGEDLSAGDQEVVRLLGQLKSVQAEYPADLLAARRSAFVRQIERAGEASILDRVLISLQSVFPSKSASPSVRPAGFMRVSLVIASLLAAVFIGTWLFSGAAGRLQTAPSPAALGAGHIVPTGISQVTITICKLEDQAPPCAPAELSPGEDLGDQGNGAVRPAVSKDARSTADGVYKAAFVNDGQGGASWVSDSTDSWIKIDLGRVTTINTVRLKKGNPGSPHDNDPGQFVIAVALSDVYADGDSSNDQTEYAPVFHSEQTGFSGTVSHTETIQTLFAPAQARFVKITFEQAGAAIEEVDVFMVQPPALAEQATRTPQADLPGITSTSIPTNTLLAMQTSTSVAMGTRLPTNTDVPMLTDTPLPGDRPTLLPTNTQPSVDTSTPVITNPLASVTPLPLPTVVPPTAVLPTVGVPTAVVPILPPPPIIPDPIIITGTGQTLTYTCNGNAAEIRGHANTVTLLGACSSITVVGNGNNVFWQSGSPVITNKGNDNLVSQL